MDTSPSPTGHLDDDVILMSLFGSSYPITTLRTEQIDKIVEACESARERLLDAMEPNIMLHLMDKRGDILLSECDAPEGSDKVAIDTLNAGRKYIRYSMALDLLKDQREKIIRCGGFIGASECGIIKHIKGAAPDDWKRASHRARSIVVRGRP